MIKPAVSAASTGISLRPVYTMRRPQGSSRARAGGENGVSFLAWASLERLWMGQNSPCLWWLTSTVPRE